MRPLALAAAAVVTLAAGPALAADLTVLVRDAAGRPTPDAVVSLRPAGGSGGAPSRLSGPFAVSQRNVQFEPFVTVVPVGVEVTFPNRDKVRHHVYSFSPTKTFELKLYGREEARGVTFDKPGVVALGCNIHDQMIAYIYVSDTPLVAKTNAAGEATIAGAPAGASQLTVWHPHMKAAKNQVVSPTVLPARGGARQTVTIDLRAARQP